MTRGLIIGICSLALLFLAGGAIAQTQPAASGDPAVPAQVRQLMELMQAPEVKQWMATQMAVPADTAETDEMSALSGLLRHARQHVSLVAGGAMALPSEVARASSLFFGEIARAGWGRMIAQFLTILLAGAVVESLVRFVLGSRRNGVAEMSGAHIAARCVPAVIFALATGLALLAFNWPPVSQKIAIVLAIALVAQRFAISLGTVLVDLITLPRGETGAEPEAGGPNRSAVLFWYRRCALFITYFVFGWAVIEVMEPLGYSPGTRYFVGYILGIGLLLIAVEAVLSRPGPWSRHKVAISSLLVVYFLLLWVLWVMGFNGLLWLGIYVLLLPRVLAVTTLAVRSLHQAEAGFLARRRIAAVLLDRGVRAIIIAAAAAWLGHMIGLAAMAMAMGEDLPERIARGVLGGVIILLAADLVWHLARTYIDGRLSDSAVGDASTDEEKAKRARLLTLLPIFRNILAVVIAVIALLMVLSGLGIQIAPLIAGAGVVGVAVGFGAQTIVKDVISGMFYLWDDAFRIGEYIESGSHKGVVEAFSLRSVKLRHHRGPLTTVPFGELGAVKNLNRDWTIDKISLNVKYDTDLVKAKKVIKEIGQQLLDNPEWGPHIIQTLKMKGVEQFGEFAIEIRLSMMTKPGEQFVIRRNALAMIRNAFKENGIEFAVPTVQVAGEREAEIQAAAARYTARARASSEPAA